MAASYGLSGSSTLIQPNWDNRSDHKGSDKSSGRKPVKGNSLKGSTKQSIPAKKILVVEDLSYGFIRCVLVPILEQDCGNNVIGLARIMEFKEETIVHLENCFYGDGSPASEFLTTLVAERPDLTIHELRHCLKQEGLPKEALSAVSSYDELEIIDDVLPMHLDELASKLTTRGRTNRDWQYVAEYFGYLKRIPQLKASVRRTVSATVELIELIKAQRPNTKVIELIKFLELIDNNEAVNALKTQLNKQN